MIFVSRAEIFWYRPPTQWKDFTVVYRLRTACRWFPFSSLRWC